MKLRFVCLVSTCLGWSLASAPSTASAAGKFAAPVQNSFTLTFDDPAGLSPGLVNFKDVEPTSNFDRFEDFDDGNPGEVAIWGSFGGSPNEIYAGVAANAGPGGAGDHAAKLSIPSKTGGGYYANLSWQVKGLMLGNSTGLTVFDSISGTDVPVPDMDTGLALTVPVKTDVASATFRVNFDSGANPASSDDGSYILGNVPGLIDQGLSGSRIYLIAPGDLPTNTWSTTMNIVTNQNPSDGNLWTNASFEPFYTRGPRSFDLTRVGVTFPGGGQVGELLVGSFTMSGPDVLKYHAADFNYDQMVDDGDIDMLFSALRALQLNAALPPAPDVDVNGRPDRIPIWGVDQVPNVALTLAEKFSISKTGSHVLDSADVDELVLNVLATVYGDLNLDGSKTASERATLVANLNTAGGWADGDLNGDGQVNAADLAIFDGPVTPGDFNGDDFVDGADFLKWQRELGTTYDAADLGDWRTNFGTMPSATLAGAAPEPTSAVLLLGAAVVLASRGRRLLRQ